MNTFESTLSIDALYLKVARDHYQNAVEAIPATKKAIKLWSQLEEEESRIIEIKEKISLGKLNDWEIANLLGEDKPRDQGYYGIESELFDRLESIAIQLIDGIQPEIDITYSMLIENLVQVYINAASAVEAHINIVADEILSGSEFDLFDKLPTEGKWLFLPKIVGLEPFDKSVEPFQSLVKLIKYRNKLVHFKAISEEWIQGSPPSFLSRLGLTIKQVKQCLQAAEKCIKELFRRRNVKEPYWLINQPYTYFESKIREDE